MTAALTAQSATIPTATLKQAITRAFPACGIKSPLSLLQHALIVVADGRMTLTCCDGVSWIQTISDASGELSACVPAAKLKAAIALAEGDAQISEDKKGLTFTCGSYSFTLPVLDTVDFPRIPEAKGEILELPFGVVSAAAQFVGHAIYRDIHKPSLRGVHIREREGALDFAAFRDHTFALARVKGSIERPVTLPTFLWENLSVLALAGDDLLKITVGQPFVQVSDGFTTIVTACVTGTFAPYERAAFDPADCGWAVSRDLVRAGIRRCLTVVLDHPSLTICGTSDGLRLSMDTALGHAEDIVEGEGSGIELRMNARYLLEALDACRSEMVRIESCAKGLFVRDGDGALALLMPLRG